MKLLKIVTDNENITVFPIKNIVSIYYNKEQDHTVIHLREGNAIVIGGKRIEQLCKLITSLTDGKVGNLDA